MSADRGRSFCLTAKRRGGMQTLTPKPWQPCRHQAADDANAEFSAKLAQLASISVRRAAAHPRRLEPEANR